MVQRYNGATVQRISSQQDVIPPLKVGAKGKSRSGNRSVPQCKFFLCCRNAFFHPSGHWFALEVMTEELRHANLEILFVRKLQRPVRFPCIVKQPRRFAKPPEGNKELYSLPPWDMTIFIVGHDKDR